MSNTNTLAIANETFNLHQRLTALQFATDIAKKEGIPTSKVKKLHQEKSKLTKKIDSNVRQILSRMTLSSNIQPTSKEPWVFVRYQDDQDQSLDTKLRLVAIVPECLGTVHVDGRESSPLTLTNLNSMLPLVCDNKAVLAYESLADIVALEELHALLPGKLTTSGGRKHWSKGSVLIEVVEREKEKEEGNEVVTPHQVEPDVEFTVSSHAGVRRVQRMLGIPDERMAEAHFKANAQSIRSDIVESVKKAEILWQDPNPDEPIDYYLDADNVVYVIGHDHSVPNVITLYEADFGFNRDINRTIILQQVKVLEEMHKLWKDTLVSTSVEHAEGLDKMQGIDDDIELLRRQLKAKEAEKKAIEAGLGKLNTDERVAEQAFNKEHSKLFKKWRLQEGL